MFSDDLYNYFIDNYPDNEDEYRQVLTGGINMCFTKIREDNEGNTDLNKLIVIIDQVCNIWKLVANQLEKVDKPMIKPSGLRDLILMKKEFKEIHHLI